MLGTYTPEGKVLSALLCSSSIDGSSRGERQLQWPQRWDGRRAQATVPGRMGPGGREDGGGPRRTGEEKHQRHLAKGKAGASLT